MKMDPLLQRFNVLYLSLTFLAIAICALPLAGWSQPPFTCGNNVFFASEIPTQLELVDPSDASATLLGTATIQYNAIGYNVSDNYLYGIQVGNFNLVRIGSDGSTVSLGAIGLPTSNNFAAGTFGGDGFLYVKQNASNNTIYVIDVTIPAIDHTVTMSVNANPADIAFDPVTGLLYGVSGNNLLSIDPVTGLTSTIGPTGSSAAFGAFYADASGALYGQSGTSGSEGFYSFDKTTGQASFVGFIPTFAPNSDGASCISATVFATDFGDAPDSSPGTGPGNYQTLQADGGPGHLIPAAPVLFLGAVPPDADINGFADGIDDQNNATDDDAEGSDDEDGVVFPASFIAGTTVNISVTISGNGLLNGWIDWNRDGVFDTTTERVGTADQAVASGTLSIPVSVPSDASTGATYARFRVCSEAGNCTGPGGQAEDGEVEDYQVTLLPCPDNELQWD